jgi:hypothetical protein
MDTSLVRIITTDKLNEYFYRANNPYNFNDGHSAVFSSQPFEEDIEKDRAFEFFNV